MKVMTILGTRPEIIRLSRVIPALDGLVRHVLVHTGQNFDPSLSDRFFAELGVRAPDHHLGVRASSFGEQAAAIIAGTDALLEQEAPDRLLVLGDTNSGLAAIPAARRGIPVYHLEAGNRCYDNRVPEETNRRIIDHASTILMPYTQRSRENLLREGIPGHRIHVVGNPIAEVLRHHGPQVEAATPLRQLGVPAKGYFLATLHRAENVDHAERLQGFMDAFSALSAQHGKPVLLSVHPRTRDRLERHAIRVDRGSVRMLDPLGFLDFVHLERHAFCVLSDSGTVQEECCIFGVPNVTLRDVTERPETLDMGSNILAGGDPKAIALAVQAAVSLGTHWQPPAEYVESAVSRQVCKIVLGHPAYQHQQP